MTAETKKNIFLQNVGPLSYTATNANKKAEPRWSMGAKIKDVDKRYSPSPQAYDLKQHTIGNNSTKWGFGTEKRKDISTKSLSPGPGAYTTKSMSFDIEKPKFFMGEKIKPLKPNTNVPGPQQYDPKPETIKKQLPSFSMKQKLGSSLTSTSIAPGPGNYNIALQTKKQAPSYGFGSSTRETGKKTNLNVPGPGAYKLKSSIGDVPDYSIPNRSDEQKYV